MISNAILSINIILFVIINSTISTLIALLLSHFNQLHIRDNIMKGFFLIRELQVYYQHPTGFLTDIYAAWYFPVSGHFPTVPCCCCCYVVARSPQLAMA